MFKDNKFLKLVRESQDSHLRTTDIPRKEMSQLRRERIRNALERETKEDCEDAIFTLHFQLLLRKWIQGWDVDQGMAVAEILRDALDNDTNVVSLSHAETDWKAAIGIAKEHLSLSPRPSQSDEQLKNLFPKQWRMAEAAIRLREAGHEVSVRNGEVHLSQKSERTIVAELMNEIRAFGARELLRGIFQELSRSYDERFDRFLIGRRPKQYDDLAEVQKPVNLLIQLALKVLTCPIKKPIGRTSSRSIGQTLQKATDILTVRGLQTFSTWEDMIIDHKNLQEFLRKSFLYDAWYNLRQCSRWFGADSFDATFDWVGEVEETGLRFTLDDVRRVRQLVERSCAGRKGPVSVPMAEIKRCVRGSFDQFTKDFIGMRVNSELRDLNSITDAYRKPLFVNGNEALVVDERLASNGFWFATLDALVRATGNARDVGSAIGKSTERWLQSELSRFSVVHGKYSNYDLDAALQSEIRVLLFEMKKIELKMGARSGNLIEGFWSLGDGFLKAHLQLARTHATLLEQRQLHLTAEQKTHFLRYVSQSVHRLAVTLFDYEGFHDMWTTHQLLELLPRLSTSHKELNDFSKWCGQLGTESQKINDLDPDVAEGRWWFRSAFLPLELVVYHVRNSADQDEFEARLTRTSTTFRTRDPFVEQRARDRLHDAARRTT